MTLRTLIHPLARLWTPVLVSALLLLSSPGNAEVARGWSTNDIPALNSFDMYVPAELNLDSPVPLVVFLHGAGATPQLFHSLLSDAADSVGAVLALPQATETLGWVDVSDRPMIEATLGAVREQIDIDPAKTSIAGHSAGGAYAYLLAYVVELPFNAILTFGAPFRTVLEIGTDYTAPIRMYYGTDDPNYTTALPQLQDQWSSLGVDFEADTVAGQGHGSLPASNVLSGFEFLNNANFPSETSDTCPTTDEQLCLVKGRFRVTVTFGTDEGGIEAARVADLRSDGSGLFYFFSPLNWEMLVKVLDGCNVTQHYWVLLAASTDRAYNVTVTDLQTGLVSTYRNEVGVASPAVVDLEAFASCES